MDTPLHAAAVPDADPATLKDPARSAGEIVHLLVDSLATHPAEGQEAHHASR